jgi:hypothetical protein
MVPRFDARESLELEEKYGLMVRPEATPRFGRFPGRRDGAILSDIYN